MAEKEKKRDGETLSDEEIRRIVTPEVLERMKEIQARIARGDTSDRGMTEEELRAALFDDAE